MSTGNASVTFAGLLLAAIGSQNGVGGIVTVSINNEGSLTEHAITLEAGEAFSVDLNVRNTEPIFDLYGLWLMASADNVLAVVGGDIAPGDLDPVSNPFGWSLPFPRELAPGDWTIGTVNLMVNEEVAPMVYTLSASGGLYTACRVCPAFGSADPGPDFAITVVPEPGSLLLVLAGALFFTRLGQNRGSSCPQHRSCS
jgi:hypothetical protein